MDILSTSPSGLSPAFSQRLCVGSYKSSSPLSIIHEAADEAVPPVHTACPREVLDDAGSRGLLAEEAYPMSPASSLGASPPADLWSLQIRHFTDCVPVESFPVTVSSSDVSDSELFEPQMAAAAEVSQVLGYRALAQGSSSSRGSSGEEAATGEETPEQRVARWLMSQTVPEACSKSLVEGASEAAPAKDEEVAFDAPDWWQEAVLARWKQQREQVSQSWVLKAKLWAEWAAFKANLFLVG